MCPRRACGAVDVELGESARLVQLDPGWHRGMRAVWDDDVHLRRLESVQAGGGRSRWTGKCAQLSRQQYGYPLSLCRRERRVVEYDDVAADSAPPLDAERGFDVVPADPDDPQLASSEDARLPLGQLSERDGNGKQIRPGRLVGLHRPAHRHRVSVLAAQGCLRADRPHGG